MRVTTSILATALFGAACPTQAQAQAADAPRKPFLATAGECLSPPPGDPEELLPLGPLALSFVPKLVGAGVDLLTAALAKAGADQPHTETINVPLEYRPRCIQIARVGFEGLRSREANPLAAADFLIEFYLRPSEDGSALAVMPTMLRYAANVEKAGTGGRPRDLFATLTFTQVGSDRAQTVTVQLGKWVARADQADVQLLPADAPGKTDTLYQTGFASSAWIAMPFIPDPMRCRQASSRPAHGTEGAQQGGGFNGGGMAAPKPTAPAPAPQGAPAPAPAPARPGPSPGDCKVEPATTGWAGKPIKPAAVSVVITEVRPGSRFAASMAKILGDSRSTIVDSLDPTKIREANAAERTERDTALKALATANALLTSKLTAYCALKTSKDRAAVATAAADLYSAQIDVAAKADGLGVPVPMVASQLINYQETKFEMCPD